MGSSVKLVNVTPDAEKTILYIARVSSNQENEATGLLRYLIRNKHWSPFEHAVMTLEFNTSRAIAAQLLRHRSFTFQEFSQRYSPVDEILRYKGRRQAERNRQSSVDDLDEETQRWWLKAQADIAVHAQGIYREALERGVARECARFVLPLSTSTKVYATGTVRSWIHYLEQRCDEHTQLEHRVLAEQARDIFIENFPVTADALGWE